MTTIYRNQRKTQSQPTSPPLTNQQLHLERAQFEQLLLNKKRESQVQTTSRNINAEEHLTPVKTPRQMTKEAVLDERQSRQEVRPQQHPAAKEKIDKQLTSTQKQAVEHQQDFREAKDRDSNLDIFEGPALATHAFYQEQNFQDSDQSHSSTRLAIDDIREQIIQSTTYPQSGLYLSVNTITLDSFVAVFDQLQDQFDDRNPMKSKEWVFSLQDGHLPVVSMALSFQPERTAEPQWRIKLTASCQDHRQALHDYRQSLEERFSLRSAKLGYLPSIDIV